MIVRNMMTMKVILTKMRATTYLKKSNQTRIV